MSENPINHVISKTAPLKVSKITFTKLINPLGASQELKQNEGEISKFPFFCKLSILIHIFL